MSCWWQNERADQCLDGKWKPAGRNISDGGDMENHQGFGTLGIAFVSGIILVYLVMVSLVMTSFVLSICSIISIPLAMIE